MSNLEVVRYSEDEAIGRLKISPWNPKNWELLILLSGPKWAASLISRRYSNQDCGFISSQDLEEEGL